MRLENESKKIFFRWQKGKIAGFIFFGVLCIGLLGGFFIGQNFSKAENQEPVQEQETADMREVSDNDYKFTNPLLDCGDINSMSNQETTEMKNKVDSFIKSQTAEKKINSAAIYFRDLNNGPSFGINEKEKFYPASLLKVPLLIAYYKGAESDPGILDKEIVYQSGGEDAYQYFPPAKKLEAGGRYTVGDLLENMIIYSDNAALSILNQMITQKKFEETYLRLGIEQPLDNEYAISVKTYASFFRILFNATYLDREYSEKALDLLSRTTFDKGLRAGVPSGIIVSHKFGEKSRSDSNEKQLHDCGIIYYPQKPYLLCIMVKGNDFSKNSDFIKNISTAIYNEVKNK